MHMISNTPDAIAFAIEIPGDRGQVGVETGTNGLIKHGSTVLGAKNDVDENV